MEENSTLSKKTQPIREHVNIRFVGANRDSNFGNFCLALTEGGYAFSVAGNRTITMYQHILDELGGFARGLYIVYERDKEIEVDPVKATGERLRKPREEAKEFMRWHMRNRR